MIPLPNNNDMINIENVEGTYFDSVFQTESARLMTLNQYIDEVKSDKHANRIARLRGLLKAGKTEEAEACKKKLPLYVAGGVMEGGRKLEHLVRYSGCIVIDIDDSPIPPEELLRRAYELPYVKAGHCSPSGTGGKLFILVDCELEYHKPAFEIVRRRVEADIPGVTVDVTGKDPNRACFFSNDLGAFYKKDAEVLRVPVCDPSLQAHAAWPVQAVPDRHSLSNYIDKFEQDNPFVPGSRHSYVVKLSSVLNNAGFPQGEVASECVRRYSCPDFATAEIEKTVADIYRRYGSSHGSNPYRPKETPGNGNAVKTVGFAPACPESAPATGKDVESVDIEIDNTLLPYFDESVYEQLPPLLADVLKRAEDRTEKDVLLVSALTLLSSVMPGVKGSLKEHTYSPAFYTIVSGSSGSGKGIMTPLQKLVDPWQEYVFDNSRRYVEEYETQKEEYENYRLSKRNNRSARPSGPPPEKPAVVKQKNLRVPGCVTQARLVELLQDNAPYTSCMFETEMEAIAYMISQDFGNYGNVLNKAAHHEPIGSSSKMNGSFLSKHSDLAMLWSGTPAILPRLIPSTENGLFSRMLMYKIAGSGKYRRLTSSDDTPVAAGYMDAIGQRVLDAGVFLDGSPTWVKFSEAQRKRLDRFLEREYYNVRSFGNEDLESTVLRYRLAIFRIAMVLTGLRKGESGNTERTWTVRDDDFNVAFHVGTTCLQHAYVVATSLKRSSDEVHFKFPHYQRNLFASQPETFKRAEILAEASVRGITTSNVDKFLRKAEKNGLIDSLGRGYYRKTKTGKQVEAV